MEPTNGIEPLNLFLTKEALYRLSYVGNRLRDPVHFRLFDFTHLPDAASSLMFFATIRMRATIRQAIIETDAEMSRQFVKNVITGPTG